jgi:hypothetical protein
MRMAIKCFFLLLYRSILLFRALVLSSIGQLFVLPLLIWSPDHRDYYGLLISFIFTILCHAQALHGKKIFLIIYANRFFFSFSFSIIITIYFFSLINNVYSSIEIFCIIFF